MTKIFGIVFLTIVALGAAEERFDGYKIVKITPSTLEQLEWILEMREIYNLDFFTEPRNLNEHFEVLMSPNLSQHLRREMREMGIDTEVKIENFQELIDRERNENIKREGKEVRIPGGRLDHSRFKELDEIYEEMDQLVASSDLISTYNAKDLTFEGRTLKILKVSSGGGDTKPVIWIDCGIHAREWVSTSVCQYILDVFASGDAESNELLEKYDFHIMPLVNPDGYKFSWHGNRVWRKNRHSYGMCKGTDPNRNFDSSFGGPGTSGSPCSDIYRGEAPFSEPESRAIRDGLLGLSGRVKMYFTLHSFSQFWMLPYGYTYNRPLNYGELYAIGLTGANALASLYGTQYRVGSISSIIYLAAGGSIDWVYDSAHIRFPYALELRDKGQHGFMLPAAQILPTAEESWKGIKASVNALP